MAGVGKKGKEKDRKLPVVSGTGVGGQREGRCSEVSSRAWRSWREMILVSVGELGGHGPELTHAETLRRRENLNAWVENPPYNPASLRTKHR
jgi:hypothetical protein